MSVRERLSPEALERAIKARIARTGAVSSEELGCPMRLTRQPEDADGRNWQLLRDSIPERLRPSIDSAASGVAGSFNLR